ncbi:SDR family oxidoreductase [Blastococcus sp. TF02A-30]|uniref:SDR family oxidoreductase n=1 Tax=Blastococcus sp. TF02A-30 TaxID=2250580 RepID=UPI000DEB2E16|nr:SDR family oxidoreductase [Blastococcus sp. TF02A-30]RBY92883.1 NAD(P)-dependent dehydrogenase [Blastococcus sp. TF02A-30]
MPDQYTMQDPTKQYPGPSEDWAQTQEGPGLEQQMPTKPDAGEETYRGSGRLAGRKAIVTGGDSGIGRATAIAFAREGADVLIVHLPEEQADAQEVVALIKDAGRTAVNLAGNLTDESFCQQVVQTAVDQLGGVDILANIAGKQQYVEDIADLTTEQFDETYKTNVYALFWLCKAAIPHMPPGSTIINTASLEAYQPMPILLDYASTKWAINGFTKALAQQVVKKGIRVNAVAPGPVWTPLEVSGGQPPEALKSFGASESPMGRPAQPAEMAPVFVFLASPESSYVSGETLAATGGVPTP